MSWNTRGSDLSGGGGAAGILTVKDFGAVGDGVADDTAAVQASIDAMGGALFPSGNYYLAWRSPTLNAILYARADTDAPYGTQSMWLAGVPGEVARITGGSLTLAPRLLKNWPSIAGVAGNTNLTQPVAQYPECGTPIKITNLNFDAVRGDNLSGLGENTYLLNVTGNSGNGQYNPALVTIHQCNFMTGSRNHTAKQSFSAVYLGGAPPYSGLTSLQPVAGAVITECSFFPYENGTGPQSVFMGEVAIALANTYFSVISNCRIAQYDRGIWIYSANSGLGLPNSNRVDSCTLITCVTGICLQEAVATTINNTVIQNTGLPVDVNSSAFTKLNGCTLLSEVPQPCCTYPMNTDYAVGADPASGTGISGFNAKGAAGGPWLLTGTCSVTAPGVNALLTLTGALSASSVSNALTLNRKHDPQLNGAYGLYMVINASDLPGIAGAWLITGYGLDKLPTSATYGRVTLTARSQFAATGYAVGTMLNKYISGTIFPAGTCVFVHNDKLAPNTTGTPRPSDVQARQCLFQTGTSITSAVPTVWATTNNLDTSLGTVTTLEICDCQSVSIGATTGPVLGSNSGYTHFMANLSSANAFARFSNNYCATPSAAFAGNPVIAATNPLGTAVAWVSAPIVASLSTIVAAIWTPVDGVYSYPTTPVLALPPSMNVGQSV